MQLALLVPGGHGQLGRELAALGTDEVSVHAPGSADLDLTSAGSVIDAVATLAETARAQGRRPVVVNAGAYTAVDRAEAERARAFAVNADGPRVLAAACSSRGIPLVHVSTDYVFPGDADRPYEVGDATGPKSAYGITKLAGEQAVLGSGARSWIVRTGWAYGAYGANIAKTFARLESERDTVSVVDDQVGSPTWTGDLARGLVELAAKIASGAPPVGRVLHCTGAGAVSWYGFARAVFEELGADPERVRPCGSRDYPTQAERPAYSALSGAAWVAEGLTPMRLWRDALAAAFLLHPKDFRP
ncbi:dTDP-4-dehydrorhamnose reductase [Actinokineospora sp.]|uniref:dTDP-4-dehydrorhamnose reductase n=1 Tax=Actinokineospora sp. TaxID=1872133 RepID=UPI0040378B82